MKNSIKNSFNRIKSDNYGSAIVVVIMALAFVGILGATIMWMSLSNYRMKVTDQENKQSFYSAEGIFDQIQIGLQADASRATDYAWSYVLQNYNNLPDDTARQSEFVTQYKTNLIKILSEGAPSSGRYNMSHIAGYIDPSINVSTTVKGDPIRYLGNPAGKDPEIVNTTQDYIILRNFELEYTDDKGFYSVIDTDIVMSAPKVVFSDASTLPEIFKFALVGNKGIDVSISGPLTVDGSIYAGDSGIDCSNAVSISGAKYVVSKGPVNLNNAAADFTLAQHVDDGNFTQFYSSDININEADFEVYANTRVADDLTLSGSGSAAILKGTYAGYGHSLSSNESSSSIVINGLNSGLDMHELSDVLLAGHSYIGTSKASAYDSTVDIGTLSSNNVDIMMGESISVKGNQLAYLVPDECIGVYKGKTVIGKNPMTGYEYTTMISQYSTAGTLASVFDDFKIVSFDKSIAAFGGQTLSNYTNNVQLIFAPSNGETLVYFYLVFDDSDKANAFFKEYYGNHKDRMEAYFNAYAKKGISMPTSGYKSQGNYVTGTAASASPTNFTASQLNNPNPMTSTALAELCNNYTEVAAALNAKLVVNYVGLSDEEKARTVFENLIDSSFDTYFPKSVPITETFTDGSVNAVLTSEASYTYDGTPANVRLIIAQNDVELKANYTGVIVAGGKITTNNGVTVTSVENAAGSEKSELISVLQVVKTLSGTDKRPIDFFINGSSYTMGGSSGSTSGSGQADLSKLISYQNWVKK